MTDQDRDLVGWIVVVLVVLWATRRAPVSSIAGWQRANPMAIMDGPLVELQTDAGDVVDPSVSGSSSCLIIEE